MIPRFYSKKIGGFLKPGRVLVLYGPRRAGKTTLLKAFIEEYGGKIYSGTGDDRFVREVLSSQSVDRIITSFRGYECVVIDEAQQIPGIGSGLKIVVDHLPEITVIASGSSSFTLSNQIGEPLTGRKKTIILYPFSVGELVRQSGVMEMEEQLETLLLYGMYPEVITAKSRDEKIEYLLELTEAYLFKDILTLENIRYPKFLKDLLLLLAFQIGHEVSLNEISNSLGTSKQTVERYLDLLEKVFVVKRVRGFSRNLRKEVTKTCRYYFYDNGIRNALINNFNFPESRNDMGMLWENFLFAERMKVREYTDIHANVYFWRTYTGQEIDLVEERGGKLYGYELKWGKKTPPPPKLWTDTYPEAEYAVIHPGNFIGFTGE